MSFRKIKTVHRIPKSNIVVDYWQPLEKDQCLRFMTNINGLKYLSETNYTIYTTPFNCLYLINSLQISEKRIVVLEFNKTKEIYDPNKNESFRVTAIEANYCIGSASFLFQGTFGNILFTGFFRWIPSSNVFEVPALKEIIEQKSMNIAFIDNTYAAKYCKFPTRAEAIKDVINIIRENPHNKIFIFAKPFGKHEVLYHVASILNENIGVSPDKFEWLKSINLADKFTKNNEKARIKVLNRIFTLDECRKIQKQHNPCSLILLTAYYGCQKPNSKSQNEINLPGLYIVPYSGHCSHSELMQFISIIQPHDIKPIILGTKDFPFHGMIPQCMRDLCYKPNLDIPLQESDFEFLTCEDAIQSKLVQDTHNLSLQSDKGIWMESTQKCDEDNTEIESKNNEKNLPLENNNEKVACTSNDSPFRNLTDGSFSRYYSSHSNISNNDNMTSSSESSSELIKPEISSVLNEFDDVINKPLLTTSIDETGSMLISGTMLTELHVTLTKNYSNEKSLEQTNLILDSDKSPVNAIKNTSAKNEKCQQKIKLIIKDKSKDVVLKTKTHSDSGNAVCKEDFSRINQNVSCLKTSKKKCDAKDLGNLLQNIGVELHTGDDENINLAYQNGTKKPMTFDENCNLENNKNKQPNSTFNSTCMNGPNYLELSHLEFHSYSRKRNITNNNDFVAKKDLMNDKNICIIHENPSHFDNSDCPKLNLNTNDVIENINLSSMENPCRSTDLYSIEQSFSQLECNKDQVKTDFCDKSNNVLPDSTENVFDVINQNTYTVENQSFDFENNSNDIDYVNNSDICILRSDENETVKNHLIEESKSLEYSSNNDANVLNICVIENVYSDQNQKSELLADYNVTNNINENTDLISITKSRKKIKLNEDVEIIPDSNEFDYENDLNYAELEHQEELNKINSDLMPASSSKITQKLQNKGIIPNSSESEVESSENSFYSCMGVQNKNTDVNNLEYMQTDLITKEKKTILDEDDIPDLNEFDENAPSNENQNKKNSGNNETYSEIISEIPPRRIQLFNAKIKVVPDSNNFKSKHRENDLGHTVAKLYKKKKTDFFKNIKTNFCLIPITHPRKKQKLNEEIRTIPERENTSIVNYFSNQLKEKNNLNFSKNTKGDSGLMLMKSLDKRNKLNVDHSIGRGENRSLSKYERKHRTINMTLYHYSLISKSDENFAIDRWKDLNGCNILSHPAYRTS